MKSTTTILLALSLLSSTAMAEMTPMGNPGQDASASTLSMAKQDASTAAMAPPDAFDNGQDASRPTN